MITIEDLLEELGTIAIMQLSSKNRRYRENIISSPADRDFIKDLSSRTSSGGEFSTKQAFIACKIVRKYAHLYNSKSQKSSRIANPRLHLTKEQVNAICDNPVYRKPPYQSTDVPREVRYLGNRKLGFKSKFSPQIIDRIKTFRDQSCPLSTQYPYFNKKYRIWVVDVTEKNLNRIMKIINQFDFKFNDEVVQFLADCSNAVEATSAAVVSEQKDKIHIVVQNNLLLASWIEDILVIEDI